MRVLIGCEESGKVRDAFRDLWHDSWSCDLKPSRHEHNSNYHIQGCVIDAIKSREWDLIILHPDCTAMAVSGNRWYGKDMPYEEQRKRSVEWTLELWELAKMHSPRVALENPVSVIFKHLPEVQYIQPWMFGHGETKKTGFALHNLPKLAPTEIVEGREQRVWKMAPGPNRKRDRSETYQGVADAMAFQWGSFCQESGCES